MEDASYAVRPIGTVRSTLRAIRDAPNQAIESPTRLRVEALEAIDGTPILDLKAVMGESNDE
jgi:tRNA (Thr-GGU) A37 N-methylase